jgi:hypothetical protein
MAVNASMASIRNSISGPERVRFFMPYFQQSYEMYN